MVRYSLKENRGVTYHPFSLLKLYKGIKRMDYDSGHSAECDSHARFVSLQSSFDVSQNFQPAKH
jgi:hypothetical protein